MDSSQQNIYSEEVKQFEALALHWWDKNGRLKSLHDINPLRMSFIQDTVNCSGKKILDIGCGGGVLSEALAEKGAHVTGIDVGKQAISVAASHAKGNNLDISYVQETVEGFSKTFPDKFDVITCMELIEHIPDPFSVISAAATLLKPGGDIFFGTINRTYKAWFFAIIGAEYILRLLPKGTHRFRDFIKPHELEIWCNNSGLTKISIKGFSYNLLTRKYFLCINTCVNYLIHFKSKIMED
ncbi:MAG: bifunctional 2-polyprenyl-6-hydroxyphenol methylase/3-demethylubiquinol 3-O-methyltransferase UbiG [Desulfobacterales bacterium]|nr:bifunctional 2-polyprenyl-6-hydroxyphenol methylase/3-demethylubiquinol 3-O-methyltransferase UbiG [Desulfobacterales bacterium]